MNEGKLIRGIGRWDFVALVVNGIIGAGIFGLPSKVFAQIGSYSLLAFVVCAVIIGLIVLVYAEVASRFTATGGPYLYARAAFGPAVGFEVGWLYWIVRVATFAANCNLLVTYLSFFIPGANDGAMRVAIVSSVVVVITAVNLIGIRESAVMTNIFTVGKLLPLVVFAIVGLFFLQPGNFAFGPLPQYSAFSSAVLLLIYAFVGFEGAVVLAGETKEPGKIMPIGLAIGIAIVTVVYVAVQVVSIGTLPGLAVSERPLADAATVFLGPFGAAFITVGIVVSIYGNINGAILTATRTLFAMSEQGDLPRFFEKIHSRFRTPYVAIVVTAVVVLVLTLQSSFLSAVAIATITRLVVYATTCLALPVFRTRKDMPAAPFSAPIGVIASILSILLIVWLLTNVDFAKEGFPSLVAVVIGLVIFALYRMLRKTAAAEPAEAEPDGST